MSKDVNIHESFKDDTFRTAFLSEMVDFVCEKKPHNLIIRDLEYAKIVRCKDCKHKPSGNSADHNVEFPDEICPCQCEDSWYSWVPKDDFFCAWGERRDDADE